MNEMRFLEYPIHQALMFVKCIWSLESNRPIYDAPRERILFDLRAAIREGAAQLLSGRDDHPSVK